jgi:hypothetical protein
MLENQGVFVIASSLGLFRLFVYRTGFALAAPAVLAYSFDLRITHALPRSKYGD